MKAVPWMARASQPSTGNAPAHSSAPEPISRIRNGEGRSKHEDKQQRAFTDGQRTGPKAGFLTKSEIRQNLI